MEELIKQSRHNNKALAVVLGHSVTRSTSKIAKKPQDSTKRTLDKLQKINIIENEFDDNPLESKKMLQTISSKYELKDDSKLLELIQSNRKRAKPPNEQLMVSEEIHQ
jgi:hypothetical protein